MVNSQQFLRDQIQKIDHVLPIQAPLNDFVHFNPLMNYESMDFADAQQAVHTQTGTLCYLSKQTYRKHYQRGRITPDDLQAILHADKNLAATDNWLTLDSVNIQYKDLYQLGLTQDIKTINYQKLLWLIEEENALTRTQADVNASVKKRLLTAAKTKGQKTEKAAIRALWQQCLQHFSLAAQPPYYDEYIDDSLNNIWQKIKKKNPSAEQIEVQKNVQQSSKKIKQSFFAELGTQITFRTLLKRLTNIDVLNDIQAMLIQQSSAWLDLGVGIQSAPKDNPPNFYQFWKMNILNDIAPYLAGSATWHDYIYSLPNDSIDTIATELMRVGIPEKDWGAYLRCLALEMPGWSGMFNWREKHANYNGVNIQIEMADYLAVRLTLEHLFCSQISRKYWQIDATLSDIRGYFSHNLEEFFVRYYTYNQILPEYLHSPAHQLLSSNQQTISIQHWSEISHQILIWQLVSQYLVNTPAYLSAWRLFHSVQHLGLCADDVTQLTMPQVQQLLSILDKLDDPNISGYLWLQAYEHHYQEEIFNALLDNHAQGSWPDRQKRRPEAQLIFCMDDREESFRRHLEEIAPHIETIGAAGVFGLPNNWKAINTEKSIKLAQPVVTAVHQFNEVADTEVSTKTAKNYQKRVKRWSALRAFRSQDLRQSVLKTSLSLPLSASFAMSELVGSSFFPAGYRSFKKTVIRKILRPITTRVDATAVEICNPPSAEHNQMGLSATEKVEKLAAYLKLTGFTKGFSRLVLLMAHSANHMNNPHILAYGCGACSGRFGGPNARAFVNIANNAEIRTQLRTQHQIDIPNDCWFIAAEHETTADGVEYFDTDLIPHSHIEEFTQLQRQLLQAIQRNAQERCRKFASASTRLSPQKSHSHVKARAVSPSQIRAELGHQGCAVAFIGRRSMHQGVFWDRRCFLVSYDPFNDLEGKVLEAQLLGNGVVGVGIAMDYYYSHIQNGYLGSGNKATHNVVGLFGVMDGACSDLQTGLAQQMTELHESMRLLVVLEAELATVEAIYQRQAAIRNLVDKQWLILAVKNPHTAEIHQFKVGSGFEVWEGKRYALPTLMQSQNAYAGHAGYLAPARIA